MRSMWKLVICHVDMEKRKLPFLTLSTRQWLKEFRCTIFSYFLKCKREKFIKNNWIVKCSRKLKNNRKIFISFSSPFWLLTNLFPLPSSIVRQKIGVAVVVSFVCDNEKRRESTNKAKEEKKKNIKIVEWLAYWWWMCIQYSVMFVYVCVRRCDFC